MRETCKMCILKHLSKAVILFAESQLGYPSHFWLAMGNLSEAEEESLLKMPDLAERIRELRLRIEEDIDEAVEIMTLIEEVSEMEID